MSINKKNMIFIIPILVCALFLYSCAYIVVPDLADSGISAESRGWTAVATEIGESESGDLRIYITIRNETYNWSAMKAAEGKPAVLDAGDSETINSNTVFWVRADTVWLRVFRCGVI